MHGYSIWVTPKEIQTWKSYEEFKTTHQWVKRKTRVSTESKLDTSWAKNITWLAVSPGTWSPWAKIKTSRHSNAIKEPETSRVKVQYTSSVFDCLFMKTYGTYICCHGNLLTVPSTMTSASTTHESSSVRHSRTVSRGMKDGQPQCLMELLNHVVKAAE